MNNFNKTIKFENEMKRGYTSSSPKRIKEGTSLKFFPKQFLPTFANYNLQNPPQDIVYNSLKQEKLREELINSKNQMNKKNKEFHVMKIAYNKLDEENRKNSKLMQDLMEEYEKSKREGVYNENYNNSILKLKEVASFKLVKYCYEFKETNM